MVSHLYTIAKKNPSSVMALLLLYLFDRMSKLLILFIQPDITIIEAVLRIRLVFNEQIVFFIDAVSSIDILIGLFVLCLLFMYIAFTLHELRGIELFLFMTVAIGAWSNISDRIWYGGVIDFIEVPFWSVFNIADIYIVIGAIILFLFQFSNSNQRLEKPNV